VTFGFFVAAITAHATIYDTKQFSAVAVGDGSYTLTIGAPTADDCNPVGSATTTWVTYGLTGAGGTFWTVPEPAAATQTFTAFPVANADFTALQERCSVRVAGTNFLLWPYEQDLVRIGFPLFHTGSGVADSASWGATLCGGGRTSGEPNQAQCPQGNTGYGPRAQNDGMFWLTFATTTAEIADDVTLTLPAASECTGAGTINVYVMRAPMTGNDEATWQQRKSGSINWQTGGGTGANDRASFVGSFTCSTSGDMTAELDLSIQDDKDELAQDGTLGFYVASGGGTWYQGSTLTEGADEATLSWTGLADNDFVLLDVAGQTSAGYIDGYFASSTAVVTQNDLGITTSTLALCSSISTTSTNWFDQLGSDVSWGICNAFSFVFVPSVPSITRFTSLKATMDTKFPFSTVASVQNALGGLAASSTDNFPEWSLSLGTSGTSTTSTTMTAANLIPKLTFFSTSTVSGYLVSNGLFQTLKTLMGYSLILGAVYVVYRRTVHVFGSSHQ